MLYLPISLFIFIVFHPQCFYSVLLLIFIVFPPPPPPPPPPLYYFPSSMFLFPPRPPPLLIYVIFPPPPPHFYCFPSKRPKRLKSGHHVRVWPFTPDFNLFGLFEGKQ